MGDHRTLSQVGDLIEKASFGEKIDKITYTLPGIIDSAAAHRMMLVPPGL